MFEDQCWCGGMKLEEANSAGGCSLTILPAAGPKVKQVKMMIGYSFAACLICVCGQSQSVSLLKLKAKPNFMLTLNISDPDFEALIDICLPFN